MGAGGGGGTGAGTGGGAGGGAGGAAGLQATKTKLEITTNPIMDSSHFFFILYLRFVILETVRSKNLSVELYHPLSSFIPLKMLFSTH